MTPQDLAVRLREAVRIAIGDLDVRAVVTIRSVGGRTQILVAIPESPEEIAAHDALVRDTLAGRPS